MHNKISNFLATAILAIAVFAIMAPVHAEEKKTSITVPEEIITISETVGAEYGICPEILQAVAWVESSFNPEAENSGCVGLMQINVRWHQDRMDKLSITDLLDPEQSMRMAAGYLMELHDRYGDIGIALMVYNGFPDAEAYVIRTGKLSEYAERVLELSSALEREHGK